MALPKAVQAQEAAANQILNGPPPAAPEGNPSKQAPAYVQPAEEPDNRQPPAVQAVIPTLTEGNPGQIEELAKLQHRFDVLQGKLNNELPRYAEQVKTLQDENASMKGQLAEKAATQDMSGALDALSEFLDEEQMDAFNKIISGQISAGLAPMRQEIATSRQEVANTRQENLTQAQSSFYANLDSMAPQWVQLNNDPSFKGWLANTARDGQTLGQMIKEKFSLLDATSVAAIFREYSPAPNQMAEQIMPGRGGAGGQTDFTQPQGTNPENIAAHYDAYRRGEVSDADHIAFETQLFGN